MRKAFGVSGYYRQSCDPALPNGPFLLLASVALLSTSLPAFDDSAITFRILRTWDYPTALATVANAVNDQDEVVGNLTRALENSGSPISARVLASRSASPTIGSAPPELTGVNNAGTVCGRYLGNDRDYHSFVFADSTFTEVEIGTTNSIKGWINVAKNLCGGTLGPYQALVVIDGTPSIFSVAGATVSQANAINSLNECVGYYYDGSATQGFRRHPDGSIDYPISAPGFLAIYLYGINDLGWMAGYSRVG